MTSFSSYYTKDLVDKGSWVIKMLGFISYFIEYQRKKENRLENNSEEDFIL